MSGLYTWSLRKRSSPEPALATKAINLFKKEFILSEERTTLQKRNAYRIRTQISHTIFRELIIEQGGEILKGTIVGRFDRPLLSCLANIATKAIMKDPRLNVVLRKG